MRTKTLLCHALFCAMLGASGLVTADLADASTLHQNTGSAPLDPTAASNQAQQTGDPVPVPTLTDEYSMTTAEPDGTFTRQSSPVPQRAEVAGSWHDLDATLRPNSDGTLSPAVSTQPLILSGGGAGPLARLKSESGATMAISWPTTLPKPTIGDADATYENVLPGVDLQVTAQASGGISEILIVDSKAAAANPKLRELVLAVKTTNATLSDDSAGNLTAVTPSGEVAFQAPLPLMWDSGDSTPSSNDATTTPPEDAEVAAVDVDVTAGKLVLTPDTSLLTDPDTNYPVFIDPQFIPAKRTVAGWVWAQEAFPGARRWNDDSIGKPAVGYQGWTAGSYGRNRSYYQFDVGTLGNAHIQAASLQLTGVDTGLFSCSATKRIDVYNSYHVGTTTSWSNQPTRASLMDSVQVSGTDNGSPCEGKSFKWMVTPAIAADNGEGSVTFRVQAPDGNESDRDYYRRFGSDGSTGAILRVNYNWPPNVPTSLAMSPTLRQQSFCSSDSGAGWLGSLDGGRYNLAANVDDRDLEKMTVVAGGRQQVRAQFAVWDKGGDGSLTDTGNYIPLGSSPGLSNWTPKADTVLAQVLESGLKDGHLYGVAARGDDDIDVSETTPDHCYFWYDASKPNVSVSASGSDFNDDGTGTGTVGVTGHFKITGSDFVPVGGNYSRIGHFRYSFNSAAELAHDGGQLADVDISSGPSISTTIDFKPTVWGSQYLYVAAIDRAGNQSDPFTYPFYVKDSSTAKVEPGDVTGDGRPDLLGATTDGNLFVYRTTSTNGKNLPAPELAAPQASAPGGENWSNTLLAHRSGTTASASGARVDDLWALKPTATNNRLRLYTNTLNKPGHMPGTGYYSTADAISIDPPECGGCAGYTQTWADVTEMVAPGDLDNNGAPDLIMTKSNGSVWFFPGTTITGILDTPQLLLASGMTGWDLINPGESTGDSAGNEVPDLWARDNRPGGSGDIRQYQVIRNSDGITIKLGTPVTQGQYFGPGQRRLVASPGDTDGDGYPELYSITPSGVLWQNETDVRSSTTLHFRTYTVIDNGVPPSGTGVNDWSQLTSLS